MIPQETVNLIMETARIEDVVGDYVTLRRRGANLVACCPFHNEKTPSFSVSPARGIYKCFGCGKAGNAVGFVMEQEHCSYSEALRIIARKYNIEIQEREETAEEIAQRQLNESLLLVSEFAQKFFAEQLKKAGEGRSIGYAYLKGRGIEDGTIEHFGLGWAPSGRTALIDAATAAGYKLEYLVLAGLAVKYEDGSVADKFRERVMFPIHSVSGRVIAFSGRTLRSDNHAKYVNSTETKIYVKSRSLMGIFFAKPDIARLGSCILVEGNVDMVMMHQTGIRNVVASCGTSLTIEQVRLIHKFTDNVTIMYDGDPAGIHAAIRGLGLVLSEGLNVKILMLPNGDDPDSFCRRHTLEEVRAYISSHERDFIGFKSDLLLDEAAGDPLKKANLINDIADTIALIPDPVKRSVYVESTAMKFGVDSSLLFTRISGERRKQKNPAQAQTQAEETSRPIEFENRTLANEERDLLGLILTDGCKFLKFPEDSEYNNGETDECTVADFIRSALEEDGAVFANTPYRKLYEAYMRHYDEGLSQEEILHRLYAMPDMELSGLAVDLSTDKKSLITVDSFVRSMTTESSWLVMNVPKAILVYQSRRLQYRIDQIRREMHTAEGENLRKLMEELVSLQIIQRRINQKTGREKKHN